MLMDKLYFQTGKKHLVIKDYTFVFIVAIILFCILFRYYTKHTLNVRIRLCLLFWNKILSDFSTGCGKNYFFFILA